MYRAFSDVNIFMMALQLLANSICVLLAGPEFWLGGNRGSSKNSIVSSVPGDVAGKQCRVSVYTRLGWGCTVYRCVYLSTWWLGQGGWVVVVVVLYNWLTWACTAWGGGGGGVGQENDWLCITDLPGGRVSYPLLPGRKMYVGGGGG